MGRSIEELNRLVDLSGNLDIGGKPLTGDGDLFPDELITILQNNSHSPLDAACKCYCCGLVVGARAERLHPNRAELWEDEKQKNIPIVKESSLDSLTYREVEIIKQFRKLNESGKLRVEEELKMFLQISWYTDPQVIKYSLVKNKVKS